MCRIRKISSLIVCALVTMGLGCRDDPAPSKPAVKAQPKLAKKSYVKPYDDDGLPIAADEDVFGDPIPQWTYSVAEDSLGAASFSSQYKYDDLVKFYEGKLGEEFEATKKKNSARFVSKTKKDHSVFVFKGRRAGQRPRVVHFNYRGEAVDAPDFVDPNPARKGIERAPWRGQRESSKPQSSRRDLYDTKLVEGADGSKTMVMTRNSNSAFGSSGSAGRDKTSSRWKADEGTAFPSNTARVQTDRKSVQF